MIALPLFSDLGPIVLNVLAVLLAITFTFCVFVIAVTGLIRWNLHCERRRYEKELRRFRIRQELREAERRREDEIRVIGRLPREVRAESSKGRFA